MKQGVAEGKITLSIVTSWYGAEVGNYKASVVIESVNWLDS
jgi:hypothetical protein